MPAQTYSTSDYCKALVTAYSRRGTEVWVAGGDKVEDSAGVIGGHVGGEVGSGFVVGFGLMAAPFHEEAVGQTSKDAVDADGIGRVQPALVVAAGDVEAGVEAVLDAPVAAVEIEPAGGLQVFGRQAG